MSFSTWKVPYLTWKLMRCPSSLTNTLGVWKPQRQAMNEASFWRCGDLKKKHSSSPSPANQILMFHCYTQKDKSARGSSTSHCWLVTRYPLMGWFEGWSPNPFLHRKWPSTPACAVSKVNTTVSKYAGERRNIEKSFGDTSSDWQHGIWQVLDPRSCNYWPSRLPIYLLLHMSSEINRSPKKRLFRKEGSLPSIIFEGIFVSFLGSTFDWDRYGKAPKHTSEWFFSVSLTRNLSQISQNKSPFTYHRVCNKYPLHHALYPTY